MAAYPVVLIAYLVIAWSDWWMPALPRHPSGEIFPFFSWDLFSSPRKDGRLYTIHVTAVTDSQVRGAMLVGRTLDDPSELRFLRDSRFQKTARSLARAHWRKRPDQVRRLTGQMANFLRPYGISEYELVYLSYHPLRYYLGEEEYEETLIHRFEVTVER